MEFMTEFEGFWCFRVSETEMERKRMKKKRSDGFIYGKLGISVIIHPTAVEFPIFSNSDGHNSERSFLSVQAFKSSLILPDSFLLQNSANSP